MQLIVDFGNTFQKLALYREDELTELKSFSGVSTAEFISWVENHGPYNGAIISTVIDFPEEIRSCLGKITPFIELGPGTPVPLKNLYATPETLGRDRIALSAGANALYPGQNVLVIDAGTCITFDLVSKKGEYLGGAISPGIEMRFKAMHTFTGKLPLIEPEVFEKLIGNTTKESMLSGVMNGTVAEVTGIISRYREEVGEMSVILTGGDHKFLYNKLKSNIFAVPDLLLKGLKIILDYNA